MTFKTIESEKLHRKEEEIWVESWRILEVTAMQ